MKVKCISVTQIDDEFYGELGERLVEDGSLSKEEFDGHLKAIAGPEGLMAYAARVSSPKQDNPKIAGLLSYCIKNHHWSVFEMADMTLEITTSRAIAQQILRHRSFSFQEFSQRYAAATTHENYPARSQDIKNRQNSVDNMSERDRVWFHDVQEHLWEESFAAYREALERGIAKEQARFLLPLNTTTKLYMKGSVRSWIHYIELRSAHGTQKEHMEIALEAKRIFCIKFPIIAEALGWKSSPQ